MGKTAARVLERSTADRAYHSLHSSLRKRATLHDENGNVPPGCHFGGIVATWIIDWYRGAMYSSWDEALMELTHAHPVLTIGRNSMRLLETR